MGHFQLSGRESVNRLVQMLQKNPASYPDSLLLNTTLIQRQTTAAPGEALPSAQTLAQELIRIARQLQQQYLRRELHVDAALGGHARQPNPRCEQNAQKPH